MKKAADAVHITKKLDYEAEKASLGGLQIRQVRQEQIVRLQHASSRATSQANQSGVEKL